MSTARPKSSNENQPASPKLLSKLFKASGSELVETGSKSLEEALEILQTPELNSQLGRYRPDTLFILSEKSRTGVIPKDTADYNSGEYLVQLGLAHKKAAQYILDTPDLLKRLAESDQTKLRESINPSITRGYSGCYW